jgi:putative membrane protein
MTRNGRAGLVPMALVAVVLSSTPLLAQAAKSFVTDAIRADVSEVKLGRLAEKKGASEGVRALGHTLDVDHTKAGEDAIGLAVALGVEPPADPKPEAQAKYLALSAMSGAAFDREFLRYIVENHQDDVRRFQAEANADDGNASALARAQLPALRRHLATAQALQKHGEQEGAQ